MVDFGRAHGRGRAMRAEPGPRILARAIKICKVKLGTNQQLAAHYGILSMSPPADLKQGQDRPTGRGRDDEGDLARLDAILFFINYSEPAPVRDFHFQAGGALTAHRCAYPACRPNRPVSSQ